ncbi:MAG: hypothetical protein ACM3N6_14215 [Betaproteobacteria bacterium]
MFERHRDGRAATHRSLSACDPDRPEADECYAAGCFDSSLDLRAGLQVIEWTLPESADQERPLTPRRH